MVGQVGHEKYGLQMVNYPRPVTDTLPSLACQSLSQVSTHVAQDHQTYSAVDQHTQIT